MTAFHVFSHHKCATRWVLQYLTRVSEINSLTFYHTDFEDDAAPAEADIAFYGNSRCSLINPTLGPSLHIIRNPLSVIVSAYYSHLKTHPTEGWPQLVPQRQLLREHDKVAGMFLTLAFLERADLAPRAIGPLLAMREWDYGSKKYQTICAEAAVLSPYQTFSPAIRTAFPDRRLAFPDDEEFAFVRFAEGRAVGNRNNDSHYRSGARDDWRHELPPAVIAYIRARFADVLSTYYADAMADQEDDAINIARCRQSVQEDGWWQRLRRGVRYRAGEWRRNRPPT